MTVQSKKKYKILIYINSLGLGGAQRVTIRLAEYLYARGYCIVIACKEDVSRDFYPTPSGIKRITSGSSKASKWLRRKLSVIRDIISLRKILIGERADLVIGMMTEPSLVLQLASLGLSLKVAVSERNHPPMKPIRHLWRLLRIILYRYADAVVVLTRGTADWIKDNISTKRIEIIPVSVALPLPRFEPSLKPAQFISQGRKIFLAVGRLHQQKGFDILLEAFHDISQALPEWDLVIAGEGEERSSLEAYIKKSNLSDRVKLLGRVGNISDWFERADVFVFSSRYEGFGNVLVEAMAFGLPVISFDCEVGPSDVILDRWNGILVERDNIAAFSKAMLLLGNSPDMRETLGKNAKEVENYYSDVQVLARWEALVKGILDGRSGV